MANICRTEINLEGNEAVTAWFSEIAKTQKAEGLIEQFGSQGESMIDRIGSKWLTKYDWGTGYLSIESAWYPPDTFLLNIYAQASVLDPNVILTGRYWDEAFSPIGIFEINYSGFHTAETNLEVDMDEEYWWDEQVEPAFSNLEL